MTVRERNLMYMLGGAAALVIVGLIVMEWVVKPLLSTSRSIEALQKEVDDENLLILQVRMEQKRLEKYKSLSLPANPEQAALDYAQFLKPLLTTCGLTEVDLQGPPAASLKQTPTQGKKSGHMVLAFNVRARGDVAGVIKMLTALKNAPIAHRIRSLTLAPTEASSKEMGKLNIQMTLEALIVHKADSLQPFLSAPDQRLVMVEGILGYLRVPGGLALAPWGIARETMKSLIAEEDDRLRNYVDIRHRNVFVGPLPAPPEFASTRDKGPKKITDPDNVRAYIRLNMTDLTVPTAHEAFLRNIIYKAPDIRLRDRGKGFDTFAIKNEALEPLMRGKVLRIEQREVYFQVVEDVYRIHIGQTLEDAMRESLSTEELDDLKLKYDPDFAEKEMKSKNPTKTKTPTKTGKKM